MKDEYSFEADNLEELYGAFIAAVDKYYEECKAKRIAPHVHYDGFNQLELPPIIDYMVDIIANIEDEDIETVLKYFVLLGVSSFIRTIDTDDDKFGVFKHMLGVE